MEDTIWLKRPTEVIPWGFRLQGGKEFQQPLTVQKVTSGSIAANSLNAGDVILRIGDTDTSTLSHSQAMIKIKSCGNALELAVSRGGSGANITSPQVQPTSYQDTSNDYCSSYPFGEPYTYSNDSGFGQGSPVSNGQPIYGGGGGGGAGRTDYDPDSPYGSPAPQQQQQTKTPPRMPDAILNMAAKGDGKKPFSYIADVNDIKEQRDRVRKKTPVNTLPRYQHVLNYPHFEDSPRARSLPKTPSTPPIHTPDSSDGAVVSNLQFNTPIQMYSDDNVVEALKGQTGGAVTDVVGLAKKDKADITQSPVYKMIHGIDQPRAKPVVKFVEAQPGTLESTGGSEIDTSSIRGNVSGDDYDAGQYDEKSIRYTGRNIPSKSFRLLQSMTGGAVVGDATPPSARRQIREPSSDDEVRFTGVNRSANVPSKAFQRLQVRGPEAGGGVGGPAPGTSVGGSEIDRSSIRQNVLGDDLQDPGEYEQTSIRYTGRNIPSKSFRMLQSLTGGPDSASPPSGSPSRRQQRRPPPQPEPEGGAQTPDEPADIRYVGGHIPSQSFKYLQQHVGSKESPVHESANSAGGDTLASSEGRRVKVVRLRSQVSQEDSGSTDF